MGESPVVVVAAEPHESDHDTGGARRAPVSHFPAHGFRIESELRQSARLIVMSYRFATRRFNAKFTDSKGRLKIARQIFLI
ncbi:hypothetical protein [Burkholderia sp. Ac-20379]|uniref:hypothetical protein n=1 Tax=Burkholderia sp. Ac-20379 TaxID=2703900 RepID=UPI00197DF16E|nr:hypothetical protein [Burkholderia sp. Ac-20379]MBN3728149.1 hypothetical protein [Burkholderia sp. Ac-20379]